MTEQPPQPPNQPPGYGYPNANPNPGPGQNPYAGEPPKGPYQQAGPYQQQPGYGYPQGGGYPQGSGYPPPGAMPPQPGMYTGDPNALYGYDPYGRPYSDKSKVVAGVLQLTLGSLGIGRFYIGHVGIGIAQLFTCGGLGIWALIDGIILLTGSNNTDAQGRILRG
ncbi:TM2 domain-containing protein [Streptomyces sp. CA-288835]|uniref:TM2 domain-containing protein n=1 Tax=Streptomyces sp. CA-288835 TaxID=3240069 RepID=UPI003D933F09